jgi:exoribonuclease R
VLEHKSLCAHLCTYLQVALDSDLLGADGVGSDSHRWVELAMIHYNRRVAYVLRNSGRGFLRTHVGSSSSDWAALAARTGCAELAYLGAAAGTYTPAENGGGHAGLGLDCYTHASSPLRRYADLVNQRYLTQAVLCGDLSVSPTTVTAAHLNARAKAAKALDRDMWFLTNLNTHGITETHGFVVGYKEEKGWSVYVPAFGRTVKSRSAGPFAIGDSVGVRVYTNLKSTSWSGRIVCSLLPVGL